MDFSIAFKPLLTAEHAKFCTKFRRGFYSAWGGKRRKKVFFPSFSTQREVSERKIEDFSL